MYALIHHRSFGDGGPSQLQPAGGRGGRPLAPARAGIISEIKGFMNELVQIIVTMLINMVKAIVPAVILIIMAPLCTILQVSGRA